MKRRTVIIPLALLTVAGALFAFFVGSESFTHWDTWYGVRITGRLVDVASDESHAGVFVLRLRRAKDAENEERIRERLAGAQSRMKEALAEANGRYPDTMHFALGTSGAWISNAAGEFEFTVIVHDGGTYRGSMPSRPHEPPPFHGVQALLLQWPNGERVVLDARSGKWTTVGEENLRATLDMGTIRVAAP